MKRITQIIPSHWMLSGFALVATNQFMPMKTKQTKSGVMQHDLAIDDLGYPDSRYRWGSDYRGLPCAEVLR